MKGKFIILFSILFMLSPSTVFAKDTCPTTFPTSIIGAEKNNDTIMPMSDVIIWRYKTIGGKTYRRKYNKTSKQWIGNWELA